MALVVKDRVKETTATTGTGTLTLAGAVAGFQTFTSVLSNGDTTYYGIFESSTGEFEVGLGTFTSSGTTLARTTILESSNSGSAINLTAGAADVFITQPAEKAVFLDASDNVNFDDNSKAIFGAGSDLQIYHDGSHSYISDQGTGGIKVLNDSWFYINNAADTATKAIFKTGGEVELYYNGNQKFETTNTGIDVTGTVTADSLTVKSPSVSGEQVIFKIENAANTGTIGQITYNQTDDTMAISNESTGILRFDTTAVERMRIDSSGNVGIGTSSPNSYSNYTTLTLNGTNGAEIDFEQSGTIKADIFTDTSHNLSIRNHGAGAIKFFNNPQTTERMRIDSSGDVLIGTTTANTTGITLHENGEIYAVRDGDNVAIFDRSTSDGNIVTFRKDGTTVGSIGVNAQRPYIGSSLASTDANIKFTDVQILPCDATGANTDGTDDIGSSSARFKDLYLSSGIKNSGDLTIDVAGDIILDADGGDIIFADGGSYKLSIANSSGDVVFVNNTTDKDFLFKGYDGASLITALTLDVSDAGTATFNAGANFGGNVDINGNLNAVDNIHVASYIYHEGDTNTSIAFDSDTITLVAGGESEITVNTTGVRLGDTGNGYFQPVSGGYGSIQIDGGAHGAYEGYSIGGRAVFMHNNSTTTGIFNDVDNEWLFKAIHGGEAVLFHNGTSKLDTTSSGVNIDGNLNAVDNIYLAAAMYHEGDTNTYLEFPSGGDAINLVTGGTGLYLNSSGVFIGDGSLAEDYDALSGTTPTCNVDNGGMFSLTMTGNTTFTFSGASSGYIQGFVLQLTGNGSTVTWPTSVDWAGGTAPDAPASGETDILVFITRDGGTNWYGALAIDAAA